MAVGRVSSPAPLHGVRGGERAVTRSSPGVCRPSRTTRPSKWVVLPAGTSGCELKKSSWRSSRRSENHSQKKTGMRSAGGAV